MLEFFSQRVTDPVPNSIAAAAFPALLLLAIGSVPLPGMNALISLPSQTAAPGSGIVLPVAFQSNGEASGLQFDIQYDNSAMKVFFASLGNTISTSQKWIYQADVASGTRRFLIVGLNSNPIPSGTLINLFVNLSPTAPVGVFPLVISNLTGSDLSGLPAEVDSSNGAVTVAGTTAQSSHLQIAGVLNGASLAAGPLAPGEIFTLVGSDIGSTSGITETHVSFDGFAASLFYVASNQINGITPYELVGRSATQMEITDGGNVISDLLVPVAAESPAIFTLDGSGVGQGAILNQDSTINSPANPASTGSIVALFTTGSGQTNPGAADGQLAGSLPLIPALPVAVQIGGIAADVVYAGTVIGLSTGLVQVNCRVPQGLTPDYAVSIVLIVAGVSSPGGVTLAVQ